MKSLSPITSRTRPAERTAARMLYVAMLVSLFVYAIVGFLILRTQIPVLPLMQAMQTPLALGLYGLGLVTFLLAGPLSAKVARATKPRAGFIAGLALLETIAVEGLMLGFARHDWRLMAPLWVLALIGFAQSYPAERIEERIDPSMMV